MSEEFGEDTGIQDSVDASDFESEVADNDFEGDFVEETEIEQSDNSEDVASEDNIDESSFADIDDSDAAIGDTDEISEESEYDNSENIEAASDTIDEIPEETSSDDAGVETEEVTNNEELEEQYDLDGEPRSIIPAEEYDDCYGHGGDDMTTYDPYASYPESHYSETDERYMDEQSEMTEATNQRALRELNEFQRLQDEEEAAENEDLEDLEEELENEEIADEQQPTPNELYEQAQQEAYDAQAEAEQWADEQNISHWSDGSERQNCNDDMQESEIANDENLSPAELYEKGQKEASDAQAAAEQWADEQNISHWSDGSERQNYNGDIQEAKIDNNIDDIPEEDVLTSEETDVNEDSDTPESTEQMRARILSSRRDGR